MHSTNQTGKSPCAVALEKARELVRNLLVQRPDGSFRPDDQTGEPGLMPCARANCGVA